MPNPTTGILDNYNLRWNWGSNTLEMNTGDETWIPVPTMDVGATWGNIVGTLSNQTDLQTALNNAGGTAVWGGITGTLSNQTDLQTQFDAKANLTNPVFGDGITVNNTIKCGDMQAQGEALNLSTTSGDVNITPGSGGGIVLKTDDAVYIANTAPVLKFVDADFNPVYAVMTGGLDAVGGACLTIDAGGVGITLTPDPTALLDLYSSTKGFLPPRLNNTERNAITVEATGVVEVVDYTALALATLTVAGHALVEGSDWTAATDNDTTAASLASAIDALDEVSATAGGTSIIAITAAVAPFSGNDITLATSDPVNLTISAATLEDGVEPAAGLMIYNRDTEQYNLFDSNGWQPITINRVSDTATTGTVTPDASLANTFYIAVTGAVTLNGPTNGYNGQKITFRILNDASHSVSLASGAGNFRFGTDIPSYTNSVSLTDYIGAIYNSLDNRWDVVSVIQGF